MKTLNKIWQWIKSWFKGKPKTMSFFDYIKTKFRKGKPIHYWHHIPKSQRRGKSYEELQELRLHGTANRIAQRIVERNPEILNRNQEGKAVKPLPGKLIDESS